MSRYTLASNYAHNPAASERAGDLTYFERLFFAVFAESTSCISTTTWFMSRDPRLPSHPAGDNPEGRTRGFFFKAPDSSFTTRRPRSPKDRSSSPAHASLSIGPAHKLSRTPPADASRLPVASSAALSAGHYRQATDASDSGGWQLSYSPTRLQIMR